MTSQANWPPLRQFASVSTALRIVSAVVLLLIIAGAYYEIRTTKRAIIADTEQQMARLDMVFAEQTGRAMEAVDLLVLAAAEAAEEDVANVAGLGDVLRRRIRGVRQVAALAVFDASGSLLVSTDADANPIPHDIITAMVAQYRNKSRTGLAISTPFRVAENKWNALLVRPMMAADGRLTGLAAGLINLSYFEDFYRAVELNENGSIILHLRDGTVLARFPHVDKAIGTSFGGLPPFTQVLANAQAGTLLMESPVDGSIRVTAIRALKAFPLAVMVSVEQGRVLVDWRREALALVAVAVVLGGAVIVLLLSLSRRSGQVERLLDETHAARNVAETANDRLLQQIAERERAEVALRQAQRIEAIGQLTGGVAHDFNNLLMVVLGNVDILQRRATEDGNAVLIDRLAAIRAAAERGATLTGHLLAFARRQPLMPKPTDLNETVRGMGNLLESALGAKARARFRLSDALWPAMVDQSQIELVILNLVINARDAMPYGGSITIETANHRRTGSTTPDGAPAGDYVSITVEDTGVGIAPDVLNRVFEPFFTTKPPGAGSGLGLSQVFGTAKQSGGEVHIRSEVGKGTAVTVDLPRAVVAPLRFSESRSEAALRGTDAMVLLVDDDDPVRAVTASMLIDLGYRVLDVASGEAAMAILVENSKIDILMTDLVMSGMNGVQLAAAARAARPHLSVIFISGYADQAGATISASDQLLRKPFGAIDLHRVVEAELLERRDALARA
jgi:signal transduction histidine kinase/ActR/RegA family two-component response regulator